MSSLNFMFQLRNTNVYEGINQRTKGDVWSNELCYLMEKSTTNLATFELVEQQNWHGYVRIWQYSNLFIRLKLGTNK